MYLMSTGSLGCDTQLLYMIWRVHAHMRTGDQPLPTCAETVSATSSIMSGHVIPLHVCSVAHKEQHMKCLECTPLQCMHQWLDTLDVLGCHFAICLSALAGCTYQRDPHRKVLSQPDQRIIHRLITMRVILPQGFTDNARTLPVQPRHLSG